MCNCIANIIEEQIQKHSASVIVDGFMPNEDLTTGRLRYQVALVIQGIDRRSIKTFFVDGKLCPFCGAAYE